MHKVATARPVPTAFRIVAECIIDLASIALFIFAVLVWAGILAGPV